MTFSTNPFLKLYQQVYIQALTVSQFILKCHITTPKVFQASPCVPYVQIECLLQ